MRYEVIRSVDDRGLHIIFAEGTFGMLPERVRQHLGPWKGLTEGDVSSLKPHYRVQLAEQGFVVLYQRISNFSEG
jgi:hypothetical protein